MNARVQLEALGLEFYEGGNTIWIHGPGGTILRIKCSGCITVTACSAPCAHADVLVEGNIAFCVPAAPIEAARKEDLPSLPAPRALAKRAARRKRP